jgi:RHS repeat-associated protein
MQKTLLFQKKTHGFSNKFMPKAFRWNNFKFKIYNAQLTIYNNKETSSQPTNASGFAEQHIQYLPFGELFVNQQNTEFDSRYKFTAKELDNETNYSYFGARYGACPAECGNSDVSIWLSVDPLSDKAPGWSPYRYGFLNPIKYFDPNGKFETKADARQYKRDNKIKGDIIKTSDNSLVSGNKYVLVDGKNNVMYYRDKSSDDIEIVFGRGEDGVIKSSGKIEKDPRPKFGLRIWGSNNNRENSPYKDYQSRESEGYKHGYPGNPLAELAGMIGRWLNGVLYPNKPENDKPESAKPMTDRERSKLEVKKDSVDIPLMDNSGKRIGSTRYPADEEGRPDFRHTGKKYYNK